MVDKVFEFYIAENCAVLYRRKFKVPVVFSMGTPPAGEDHLWSTEFCYLDEYLKHGYHVRVEEFVYKLNLILLPYDPKIILQYVEVFNKYGSKEILSLPESIRRRLVQKRLPNF
jgi:hypothetical protein